MEPKQYPPPNPGYVTVPTKRISPDTWEICGSRYPEFARDMAFWANDGKGRK